MGEVKSTIDLVLEKTRALTLSKEEKLKLAREELDKKVHGLINRYLDNLLPVSRLKGEMERLDTGEHGLAYKLLKKHLLAHFDLEGDNSSILAALSEIVSFDIAPLGTLQKEYQSEKEESKKAFSKKILSALEERSISGSAVVANLNHNPDWNQFLKGLSKTYQERINTIGNG